MIYSGQIGDRFLKDLISSDDRKLILNSGGGCCGAMRAALDVIEGNDWTVVATGSCMSAALPLVAAGKMRYTTRRTRFMVHAGSVDVGRAGAAEVQAEGTEFGGIDSDYWHDLGKFTKKSAAWWKARCVGKPYYFSAREAKKLGVVDRVL